VPNRMRVIGWNVQPVVMADDGENLTPVNVQAQMIPVAQWQAFKDGGDVAALKSVRAQIEAPESPVVPVKPEKRTNAPKP